METSDKKEDKSGSVASAQDVSTSSRISSEQNVIQETQSNATNSIVVNQQVQSEIDSNEELKDNISLSYGEKLDEIIENFDPEKMIKSVQGWSLGKLILLFVCILLLSVLLAYMDWKLISFLWKHLMAFIDKYGDEVIKFGGECLNYISNTAPFTYFRNQLNQLTSESSELTIDPSTITSIIFGGYPFIFTVVKQLFTYLRQQYKS